jgi:hypothetical protein
MTTLEIDDLFLILGVYAVPKRRGLFLAGELPP